MYVCIHCNKELKALKCPKCGITYGMFENIDLESELRHRRHELVTKARLDNHEICELRELQKYFGEGLDNLGNGQIISP